MHHSIMHGSIFEWTAKTKGMPIEYLSSLWRFRRIDVTWKPELFHSFFPPEEEEIDGLLSLRNVATFICKCRASEEQYTRLFNSIATSFPYLTELTLGESFRLPPNFCSLLISASSITSLQMQDDVYLEYLEGEQLIALPELVNLKKLQYAANYWKNVYNTDYDHLPIVSIAQCTQLTELTFLRPPCLDDNWMTRFFTTLQSSHLQTLTFYEFEIGEKKDNSITAPAIPVKHFFDGLISPQLQYLETLKFDMVDGDDVNLLLPMLIHMHQLTHLILRCGATLKVIADLLEATTTVCHRTILFVFFLLIQFLLLLLLLLLFPLFFISSLSFPSSSSPSRLHSLRITYYWSLNYFWLHESNSLKDFRNLEASRPERFSVIEEKR